MNILDSINSLVRFTVSKDKKIITIHTMCDCYYKESLTKDELTALLYELTTLRDSMS